MTDESPPAQHRGLDRPHTPAVVCELGKVELPSGRIVLFRHESFGGGHALVVATRDPRGRESFVRLPLGTMPELREAINALVSRARAAAAEAPIAGRRGVPRGATTPPVAARRVPPPAPTERRR